MPGILSRLPDLSAAQSSQETASGGLGSLLSGLGGASSGGSGSPLEAVSSVIGGLSQRLNLDLSGLGQLSSTFGTIEHALPQGSRDFLGSLEQGFDAARATLGDSALARAVSSGSSLQDTALAVIEQALAGFGEQRTRLGSSIVDDLK